MYIVYMYNDSFFIDFWRSVLGNLKQNRQNLGYVWFIIQDERIYSRSYTNRSAQEKSSFFAFRRGTLLARNIFFPRRKIKITYFAESFLRAIWRRNSAKVRGETPRHFADTRAARFCGDTPRNFAEKLREISQWVGKDQRFLHPSSEDSEQTEKLSECSAWYESSLRLASAQEIRITKNIHFNIIDENSSLIAGHEKKNQISGDWSHFI